MEVTDCLHYFARTIIEAQSTTISRVDFHVAKAKFATRDLQDLVEKRAFEKAGELRYTRYKLALPYVKARAYRL